MNQQDFENWLDTVARWIKMMDPRCNPPPKARSIDHPDAMCVIKALLDRPGTCDQCNRHCKNPPVRTHRWHPELRYWLTRCNHCSMYLNPRTNKYDLSVGKMGTIGQYYKALREKESLEVTNQQLPLESQSPQSGHLTND